MFRKGDELIPGYRLEEFLGRGQFGEVWRTTAPGRTSAALKFIDLSGKQGLKEFRAVQRVKEIRHAHLMPITALWMLDENRRVMEDNVLDTYRGDVRTSSTLIAPQHDSQPAWLVVGMLLGHGSLADRLEAYQHKGQNGIPVPELLRYMEEAAKGIDFLNTRQHDLGDGLVSIQHCDIKPANIMLVGDSVVVCDFGLARVLSDTQATATGMVGSPAYMPPECILKRPSSASDQYSLAISYVELRTGRLPFFDESYVAVLDSHRTGKLDLRGLTASEVTVIRKATAVNPDDRYPTTSDMVQALRRAFEPNAGRQKASPVAAWSAVLVILVAAVAGGGWWYWENRPKPIPVNPSADLVRRGEEFVSQDRIDDAVAMFTKALSADSNASNLRSRQEYQDHKAMVGAIAIDANSKWIAVGSDDRTATLRKFPISNDSPAVTLKGHKGFVNYVAFSGNDRTLITASWESILLWDATKDWSAENAPSPVVLEGHEGDITAIQLSPDGNVLATGDAAGTVRLWNLGAALPPTRRELKGHSEQIRAICFSADGRTVLSACQDNVIMGWKTAPNESTDPRPIGTMEGDVTSLAYLEQGSVWAMGMGNGNIEFRSSEGDPLEAVNAHRDSVTNLIVEPKSRKLVASMSVDRTISIFNLAATDPWKNPRVLSGHTDAVNTGLFSPDGNLFISGSWDGSIIVWNLTAGDSTKSPLRLVGQGRVARVILSSDGQWLISSWDDGLVRIWDFRACKAMLRALEEQKGVAAPFEA